MTTIVVSIGRNIGDTPMVATLWEGFIEAIDRVVFADSNGEIFGRARGRGEWNGVGEDNYIVIGDIHSSAIEGAKRRASLIGKAVHQDAVGFVVHDHANQGDSLV